MFLKKLLKNAADQKEQERRAEAYNNLIRREAKIGGKIFGPLEKGRHREFFCLDEHTLVWHEEWKDSLGEKHTLTTHYSVRPDGVLKSQNHGQYQMVSPKEAYRLFKATQIYAAKIEQFYALPSA